MGINKTSLNASKASLNDVSRKFRLNQPSVAGRHHLRLKDGVLFTRVMDITKFKAVVLRDPTARQKLRDERSDAVAWLTQQTAKEYGANIPDAICLRSHDRLRGHHAGVSMQAHAAVAAAEEQMGFGKNLVGDEDLDKALREGARTFVSGLGPSTSPETRVQEAKLYLIREIALCLLPGLCMDMSDEAVEQRARAVDFLCQYLHTMPMCSKLDLHVAKGMLQLLGKSDDELALDNGPRLLIQLEDEIIIRIANMQNKRKLD